MIATNKRLNNVALSDNLLYICQMENEKYRQIVFYKEYFQKFFAEQSEKVKAKIGCLKKRKYNTILKIYRSVTIDEAREFDTEKLINVVLANLFCSEPTNYYITGPYPDDGWITKNGFLRAVKKKNYKDICHLLISNDKILFSFTNWLLNYKKPKMKDYQSIEFYASDDIYNSSDMEEFIKVLYEIFPLEYGFIFSLQDNYDPSTESKIKKGFFSVTVTVKSRPPFEKEQIRGIYPINFINESIFNHNDFKKYILGNNIGSLNTFCSGIKKWVLKEDEIEKAKIKLSESEVLLK